MRYFIPEWDDKVDPNYDFLKDRYSSEHLTPKKRDVYMWEIFGAQEVPFDGILVSLISVKDNGRKEKDIKKIGDLHKYLRLPEKIPILADCGAWGYIKEEKPRFGAIEVLEIYRELGVQEAVTVDHLVTSNTNAHERMKITRENGINGFKAWKKRYREDFDLLVSVQGLLPRDYLKMYCEYAKYGIDSFAFGGLARKPTHLIIEIIESLINEIKRKKNVERIHFFGLGRTKIFSKFKELEDLGISVSFDTASWLRRSWLSGEYFLADSNGLKRYTAIRVPMTDPNRSSFRGKRKLSADADMIGLKHLEDECLNALRSYEKGRRSLDEALSIMKRFNEKILVETEKFLKQKYGNLSEVKKEMKKKRNFYRDLEMKYRETLEERPWTKCDCKICRKIGIEVVLFRGNNRNRRRGFHNVYTMYHKFLKNPKIWKIKEVEKRTITSEELEALKGKVLIITQCTKKKIAYNAKIRVKAENMYQGRLFKLVKAYAKVKNFPLAVISAKYGLLWPNEIIEGYDEVLRTNVDIEKIKKIVNKRLFSILQKFDKIVVIAGEKYRKTLDELWDDRFVYVKSKGYADLCKILDGTIKKICECKLTDF